MTNHKRKKKRVGWGEGQWDKVGGAKNGIEGVKWKSRRYGEMKEECVEGRGAGRGEGKVKHERRGKKLSKTLKFNEKNLAKN